MSYSSPIPTLVFGKIIAGGVTEIVMPEDIEKNLVSENIIFSYHYQTKKMITWIGNLSSQHLRMRLSDAKQHFIESRERIRPLRNIVFQEGDESMVFFQMMGVDAESFRKRLNEWRSEHVQEVLDQENIRIEEIGKLKVRFNDEIVAFKFKEADITLSEINDIKEKLITSKALKEVNQFCAESAKKIRIGKKMQAISEKYAGPIQSIRDLISDGNYEEAIEKLEPLQEDIHHQGVQNLNDEIDQLWAEVKGFANHSNEERKTLNDLVDKSNWLMEQDTILHSLDIINNVIDEATEIGAEDVLNEWIAKEEAFLIEKEAMIQKINELGEKIADESEQNVWSLNVCSEIIEIAEKLGDAAIQSKYRKIYIKLKQDLDDKRVKMSEIAVNIDDDLESYQMERSGLILEKCDQMILIAEQLGESEVVSQYKSLKVEIESKSAQYEEEQVLLVEKTLIQTQIDDLNNNQESLDNPVDRLKILEEIILLAEKLGDEDVKTKYVAEYDKLRSELDRIRERLNNIAFETDNLLADAPLAQSQVIQNNCDQIIELADQLGVLDFSEKYSEVKALNIAQLEENEKVQGEKAAENAKVIEKFGFAEHIKNGVMPVVESIAIDDLFNGIDDNVDEIIDRLSEQVDLHRVVVSNEVSSSSTITTKSGQVYQTVQENEVIESSDNETTFANSFLNDIGEAIDQSIMEDVIPFNFEIKDMTCERSADGSVESDEEVLEDGLHIKWVIKDIAEGESIDLKYKLRRRISRTMVIPTKTELIFIKVHKNIEQEENEKMLKVGVNYTNNLGEKVENIIIEDQIPKFYKVHVQVDSDGDFEIIDGEVHHIVKWYLSEVSEEKTIAQNYQLMDIILFEDLKIELHQSIEEIKKEMNNFNLLGAATNLKEMNSNIEEML